MAYIIHSYGSWFVLASPTLWWDLFTICKKMIVAFFKLNLKNFGTCQTPMLELSCENS